MWCWRRLPGTGWTRIERFKRRRGSLFREEPWALCGPGPTLTGRSSRRRKPCSRRCRRARAGLAARSAQGTRSGSARSWTPRTGLKRYCGSQMTPSFAQPEHKTLTWDVPLTADELIGLLGTFSWIITMPDDRRAQVISLARQVLRDGLGISGDVTVTFSIGLRFGGLTWPDVQLTNVPKPDPLGFHQSYPRSADWQRVNGSKHKCSRGDLSPALEDRRQA
jgi:hypothetical protein